MVINESNLYSLFERKREAESKNTRKNKEFLKAMLINLSQHKEKMNNILETLTYMNAKGLKEQLDDCSSVSNMIKGYQFGYQTVGEDIDYSYLYYTNNDWDPFGSYIIKYFPHSDYMFIGYTTPMKTTWSITARLVNEYNEMKLDASRTCLDFMFSQYNIVKFMDKFIERIPGLLDDTINSINEIK